MTYRYSREQFELDRSLLFDGALKQPPKATFVYLQMRFPTISIARFGLRRQAAALFIEAFLQPHFDNGLPVNCEKLRLLVYWSTFSSLAFVRRSQAQPHMLTRAALNQCRRLEEGRTYGQIGLHRFAQIDCSPFPGRRELPAPEEHRD